MEVAYLAYRRGDRAPPPATGSTTDQQQYTASATQLTVHMPDAAAAVAQTPPVPKSLALLGNASTGTLARGPAAATPSEAASLEGSALLNMGALRPSVPPARHLSLIHI